MEKTETERLLEERTAELALYKAAYDLAQRKLENIRRIFEDFENP